MLAGALQHRRQRAVEAGEQLGARRSQLQGEAGVDDIGRGEAVVEPARLLADLLGDGLGEGDHVVVRAPLDLLGALDERRIGVRARAHGGHGALGHDTELLPGRQRGELDLEPAAQAPLVAPDGCKPGERVAGDHLGSIEASPAPSSLATSASASTSASVER